LASVGQKPVFADEKTTFKVITGPDFDPRTTVFVPLEARPFASAVASHLDARIVAASYSAHRAEIQITAPEAAWLVIAQNNYHCWRATSDGDPLRLWQAN